MTDVMNTFTNTDEKFSGDFRLFLQAELMRRCRANPAYSLRSFSRFLGLESSRLSKILRGLRPVSVKLIPRLGQRLGLSQLEIDEFCTIANAKRAGRKNGKSVSNQTYRHITRDAFETIEDWRHYAVLELMKVKGFQPEIKWLSRALGVTVSEARGYVERLQRVGMLEIRTDGSWWDKSEGFSSHIYNVNDTSYAHRRAQKRILELAAQSLELVPIERRDQSSMMMATSRAKIAEAKRRIQDFRRELCEFLEDGNEAEELYQLSISLFPLIETDMNNRGNK